MKRTLHIKDHVFDQYTLTTIDGTSIYDVAVVSEEDYKAFEKSTNEIVQYDRSGVLKKYIQISAKALESAVSDALKPGIGNVTNEQSLELLNELNLKLINFLAILSLTLDHTRTRLTRTYGADSEILKSFDLSDRAEYDAYFNYRFLKRLRNFVVHCEQPISHYTLSSKLDNPPFTQNVTYQRKIGFDRKALVEKFDGWSTVKKELQGDTSYIHLSGVTDDVVACLDRILDAVGKAELPMIHKHAQLIMDIIEPALYRNNGVGIGTYTDLGAGKVTMWHKDAPLLILEKLGYDIRGTNDDSFIDDRIRDRPPGPRF